MNIDAIPRRLMTTSQSGSRCCTQARLPQPAPDTMQLDSRQMGLPIRSCTQHLAECSSHGRYPYCPQRRERHMYALAHAKRITSLSDPIPPVRRSSLTKGRRLRPRGLVHLLRVGIVCPGSARTDRGLQSYQRRERGVILMIFVLREVFFVVVLERGSCTKGRSVQCHWRGMIGRKRGRRED